MPKVNDEFVANSGAPGGPLDDDEMRRKIRGSYRRLINDINTKRPELISEPPVVLKELIDRTDSLFIKVKHCREAALDAQCVSSIAQLGRKKVEALSTGFDNFNVHEFCEKLIIQLRGNASVLDEESDDDTCKRKLRPVDWTTLGTGCQTFFMRSTPLHFMFGSFEHEVPVKTPRPTPVRTKDNNDQLPTVSPKVKGNFNTEDDKERTSLAVDEVLRTLRKQYRLNNRQPMCFMEFVVNPLSFSQTVENVFHTSFLVKDGLARLFIDDEGLPAIEPLLDASTGASTDDVIHQQMVMAWTMESWRAIVDSYKIDKPIIPHRAE